MVQKCVKHGTVEQRQEIIEELKDHFLPMMKSRYGKFLAKKLLMYANAEQRKWLLGQFKGIARKMIKQKDSADVLEYAFSEYMNAGMRRQVLFEICSPELADMPGSQAESLRSIFARGDVLRNKRTCEDVEHLLTRWVEKEMLKNSVVHAVLWEYAVCVPDARRDGFIGMLKDVMVHFSHTQAGSRVAHFCVSYASAKDRKAMVKSFRPYVEGTASDEFGSVALTQLLMVMDDTRTSSSLLKPLLELSVAPQLLANSYVSRLFLHILAPCSKTHFPEWWIELMEPQARVKDEQSGEMVPTSKKPADVRQQELLDVVVGPLIDVFLGELRTIVSSITLDEKNYGEDRLLASKNTLGILYELLTLKQEKYTNSIQSLFEELLRVISCQANLLGRFHTSRMLKRLVTHAVEGASATHLDFVRNFWGDLEKKGHRYVLFLLRTKGASFIVVAFGENPLLQKTVIEFMKPMKSKVAEIEEAPAKLFLKLLTGDSAPPPSAGKTSAKTSAKTPAQKKQKK